MLNTKYILSNIWIHPNKTLMEIHETKFDQYKFLWLVLGGFVGGFFRAAGNSAGDNWSLTAIIAVSFIAGGLVGVLFFWLFAALISWTGKWLSGQGTTDDILRMISFSFIPVILAIIVLIPQMAIMGVEIFKSEPSFLHLSRKQTLLYLGCTIAASLLYLYSLILKVIGIAKAQNFSIVKSILNIVLSFAIFAAPIILVMSF